MSETQLKNYNNVKSTDLISPHKKAGKGLQLGHRVMNINLFDMQVIQANELQQPLSRIQHSKTSKWTVAMFLVSHVNTITPT